jgi:urocanate hydratase
MNSLDPEVAEHPEELIACGASGKSVADWPNFLAITAALKTLENDQTLLVNAGKAAGTFSTSTAAPRVVIRGHASAAAWMYVGTQGALQETYEAFHLIAQSLFAGDLAGRLVVSTGMGSLGGAQALAAQWNGAVFLGIDADPARIKRHVKSGYCDVMVSSLDEALRILKNAVRQRAARSVGLVGNVADVMAELAERGVVPDVLTDRMPAARQPDERLPMRWVALSGEPSDIDRIDRLVLEVCSDDEALDRFIRLAKKHLRAQGLPARVCEMRRTDAVAFAIAVNDLVTRRELKGPVVLGRNFLNCRDHEGSAEPSAIGIENESIFPRLQAELDATSGASWTATPAPAEAQGAPKRFGQAIVTDGAPGTAARIERVMSR